MRSGADYIDYLKPFVAHALARVNGIQASPETIHGIVRNEFGLLIPRRAIDVVLRRLARDGFGRRERGEFTINREKAQTVDLGLARAEALRRENVVVNGLLACAPSLGLTWAKEDAVGALLNYLRRFSIDCLRTYAHGSALPEADRQRQPIELYTVSSFVRSAHATSSALFDDVIVLVKGQMLANALLLVPISMVRSRSSKTLPSTSIHPSG